MTWLFKKIHWYRIMSLEIRELERELATWKVACAAKQAEIDILNQIILQLRKGYQA